MSHKNKKYERKIEKRYNPKKIESKFIQENKEGKQREIKQE